MEVKQEGVVAAIKKIHFVFLLTSLASAHAQIDSLGQFKKKVLETVEVDLLMSYYEQAGTHAAVTGGLGNEYLTDYNPTIVVRIPVNEDAVLTADVGMSAYTSASSTMVIHLIAQVLRVIIMKMSPTPEEIPRAHHHRVLLGLLLQVPQEKMY